MSSHLRKNEKCPLHQSYFCCGREKKAPSVSKGITHHGPVTKIPDATVAKGYREICTPAELKRRKDIKIREQDGICPLCGEPMDDYRFIELDHKGPKGMGGAFRDDSLENLQATHKHCNREKGSIRMIDGPTGQKPCKKKEVQL